MFFHIAETVFLDLAAKPAVDVLHDAQGADDAAIDPAEKQCYDNDGHCDERQGKHCGQELDLSRPTDPLADAVAGSYEEGGDQQDHDDGEGDSELF